MDDLYKSGNRSYHTVQLIDCTKFFCTNSNLQSLTIKTLIVIMLSVPKTSRREHSSEMVTTILTLCNDGKPLAQIGD